MQDIASASSDPTDAAAESATTTDASAGASADRLSTNHPCVATKAAQLRPTPRLPDVLWVYFILTYGALLVNTNGLLKHIHQSGLVLSLYAKAVQVTYTFFYLIPVILVTLATCSLIRLSIWDKLFVHPDRQRSRIVFGVAILSASALQYLLFADKMVFDVFGFHLNGFVWNLVTTRGGIESMGADSGTTALAVAAGVGFFCVQIAILLIALKVDRLRHWMARFRRRRPIALSVATFSIACLYAQVGYGVSAFRDPGPTQAVAESFPGFIPTTFGGLASSLGYETLRNPTLALQNTSHSLRYPLHELHRDPNVKPLNIVWLVSESLRADMLDPEIMPNAWALSLRASRFEHHYSGGNGTRMGMFSMFYGLYGPYWFTFLAERRGPVLMDTVIDLGYQIDLYTSAMFSYPEFDKTLFSRIPSDRLHEGGMKPAWRQDQRHVNSILKFIEERDPSKPFMTFLFFESPHANYSFSRNAIIRRPYLEEFNYVSTDLDKDIDFIKNRYINACHQIDLSIGRILGFLRDHDLLESTIVLITGDHGEEFMEKGRWGHNSEFTEEQTLVPLVLWVPGTSPRVVTRMTSHLDIPATLLHILGVTNPPSDYSLGYDLFGPEERTFTVISAWNHMAYVDRRFKATFPTSTFAFFHQTVTTQDDKPISDPRSFYQTHQQTIVRIMHDLKMFRN